MDDSKWPTLTHSGGKRLLRRLELEAYASVVTAFRAQGPLSRDKKSSLEMLCKCLGISAERHRAEVRRAVNDEILAQVADSMCGIETERVWRREGQKLLSSLPPRLISHQHSTFLPQALTALATATNLTTTSLGTNPSAAGTSVDITVRKVPTPIQNALRVILSQVKSESTTSETPRHVPPTHKVSPVKSSAVMEGATAVSGKIDPSGKMYSQLESLLCEEKLTPTKSGCGVEERGVSESIVDDGSEKENEIVKTDTDEPLSKPPHSTSHCPSSRDVSKVKDDGVGDGVSDGDGSVMSGGSDGSVSKKHLLTPDQSDLPPAKKPLLLLSSTSTTHPITSEHASVEVATLSSVKTTPISIEATHINIETTPSPVGTVVARIIPTAHTLSSLSSGTTPPVSVTTAILSQGGTSNNTPIMVHSSSSVAIATPPFTQAPPTSVASPFVLPPLPCMSTPSLSSISINLSSPMPPPYHLPAGTVTPMPATSLPLPATPLVPVIHSHPRHLSLTQGAGTLSHPSFTSPSLSEHLTDSPEAADTLIINDLIQDTSDMAVSSLASQLGLEDATPLFNLDFISMLQPSPSTEDHTPMGNNQTPSVQALFSPPADDLMTKHQQHQDVLSSQSQHLASQDILSTSSAILCSPVLASSLPSILPQSAPPCSTSSQHYPLPTLSLSSPVDDFHGPSSSVEYLDLTDIGSLVGSAEDASKLLEGIPEDMARSIQTIVQLDEQTWK